VNGDAATAGEGCGHLRLPRGGSGRCRRRCCWCALLFVVATTALSLLSSSSTRAATATSSPFFTHYSYQLGKIDVNALYIDIIVMRRRQGSNKRAQKIST
jgi:hypothetical protein